MDLNPRKSNAVLMWNKMFGLFYSRVYERTILQHDTRPNSRSSVCDPIETKWRFSENVRSFFDFTSSSDQCHRYHLVTCHWLSEKDSHRLCAIRVCERWAVLDHPVDKSSSQTHFRIFVLGNRLLSIKMHQCNIWGALLVDYQNCSTKHLCLVADIELIVTHYSG